MALPRSTTSSSSYQYHLNSMIPDHYRNQFMLQDAYAAGLRASMNLGPTAWQPNWPANPHCSSDLVASSAAETSTGFHPHQLAPPGPFVPAFSPVCGSQLEKVDAVSPSYHQFSPSSSAAQAFKQDSWSANGQFSRPSVSHFLEGPLNLASMERLTNSVQRKANEHMVRPNSADLVQQLSQRLACDSNQSSPGPCLASNLARFLQFGRQEVEPRASAWSGSSNGLSTGDVAVEQSGPRTGTSPGCVAHYPFDPGFAERAARLSSLSSLMYSFSVDERDKHRVPLSVGEASPRKFMTAPSSPSQGLSSPLADSVSKRSVTFAMGSADAKGSPKNLKHELSDDSTPTRGQPDEDANRVFPSGVVPTRRQRLTHCEQAKGLDEANSGGYPVACSSPIAGKDCFHLKKRRIEIEDIPDDVSSEHQNSGRQPKIADPTTDSSPKRQKSPSIAKCSKEEMKADEGKETGNSSAKMSPKSGKEQTSQPTETPKQDFIHVRARRGQATDSHSLAERVRREKISERMRFLQDLVPGCNKITGKAMMLDEIINYVQSLQHQIEFLSMKLAALNPRVDFNIDSFFAGGEVLPPNEIGSVTETTTTSGGLSYQQMLHACLSLRDPPETFIIPTCSNGIPTETALDRAGTSFISSSLVVANNDGFSQAASAGWEGNLQGMTRGPDIDYEGRRTLFTTSDAEGDRLLGSIENVKIEL